MKITYLFLLTLLSFATKPKDDSKLPKQTSNNLCAAIVYSVTNNGSGGIVKFVKLNGCGASTNNSMNLSSGTVLLNNGPTCTSKSIFILVTGTFSSIDLVQYGPNGIVVLASEPHDPTNSTGRYSFEIGNCPVVDIIVR